MLFVTADFRYLYGFTEVVSPTAGVKGNWKEISTIAGFVFDF